MQKPLVTIIVITYNSSKTVLETLESSKLQTYNNLELIISDDCSTDNTTKICQEWLNANNGWFKNTLLLTSKNNTGTAGNLNRGIKSSRGIWVKFIAGDDALNPNIIESYIEYINNNEEILFLHSNVEKYTLLLGSLLVLTQGSAVAPFIYTLF